MSKIVMIIMVMIGLVIGANLITPINSAVTVVAGATPALATSITSLANLLPLLFVVVLMVFAVNSINV